MSAKKTYTLPKQNLDECLLREPPESILRSDSEPKEYEPVWGNMQKMTVYLSEDGNDFEIKVEELDVPFENNPDEEDDEELNDQSVKTMMEALEKENGDDMGIHNLLIPEVKQYYTMARKVINSKYGIISKRTLPEANSSNEYEALEYTSDNEEINAISEKTDIKDIF